jgi:hypothetical protein
LNTSFWLGSLSDSMSDVMENWTALLSAIAAGAARTNTAAAAA